MTAPPQTLRVTRSVRDVMTAILAATPDDPAWGYSICRDTGRPTGTIYPTLAKLMKAGWITDWWEDPPRPGKLSRRFYRPAYAPFWYQERLK